MTALDWIERYVSGNQHNELDFPSLSVFENTSKGRSSMKALEETLMQHGLIRCHRSYFVNPSYIKIVHRNNAGLIVAELNQEGYESIPISQKYQDQIAKIV